MKVLALTSFAVTTAAFALPGWEFLNQFPIHPEDSEASGWPALDSIVSEVKNDINLMKYSFDEAVDDFFTDDELDLAADGHHESNLTIYQLISGNKHTTKFAKLINEHDSLVKLLNSTETNSTLFVPLDSAFDKIPDDAKKPPKEFIDALLQYHVCDEQYRARDLIPMHTLPTILEERWLGGEAQRLRVRVGLMGIRVNFYSKVMVANLGATNGVVHFVNHILVPPAMVGRELSLFPTAFSTLLHAYEKTDFVKFIHGVKMVGSTVFAPTNSAFAKLGPAANAFLFNTPKGLKYLEALLKYQIVANATLYSDTLYDSTQGADALDREHFELETLLDGKSIGVDITKWHGLITSMRVNHRVRVKVQDGIAKNGVIQVVDRVPFPPHKHHEDNMEGEISVEDLEAMLAPYVESSSNNGVGEL